MGIFSAVRFYLSMLLKAPSYNYNLIKLKNNKFFYNDNKVIGWVNGYPTFNLYTPPLFSKPSINTMITKVMSLYQWRKLPELMSIAVTDQCNCNCAYCSFTTVKQDKTVLTTEMIKDTICQAQELGVSTIQIVGGEPLINPDIIDIIESVDKEKSQVILFTNGYHLKDKARALKKAGLTSVIISMDSHEAEEHDSIKGKPGFFVKAIEGIKEAKKQHLLVGVSSVLHKEDLDNQRFFNIIELSKNLKVNENIIFEAIPTGNYSNKKDLVWSKNDVDKLLKLCKTYSKKRNYPGIYPYSHLKSSNGIGCSGGVLYFYVNPYGDVCPCDFNPLSVGNVKNGPLYQIWDKFNETNGYDKTNLNGCRRQMSN